MVFIWYHQAYVMVFQYKVIPVLPKLHSKYNLPSSTQPDHTQYEVLLQIDL